MVTNVHDFLSNDNLPLVERVEIDGERWYRLPGESDPANYFASVTNILSVAQPKPLTEYYKRTSYRKQTQQLEKAADLGTRIHEIIDKDLQGIAITKSDLQFNEIDLTDWFKRWEKLRVEKNIKADALEVPVVNMKYGYAGTLDVLGSFMGEPAIFDIKSGFYGVKAGYQLIAYKRAYNAMLCPQEQDDHDHSNVRLVGLSLPWNRTANTFVYEHEDFCWNRFLDALGLFRGLNYHRLDKMKWRYLHVERDGNTA